MAAQPRFRAGMVGAGNICQYHVAAVQALPDVELVGITDLDQRRAEDAAAEWGTRAFPSMEALVEAGANVIHVNTPPSSHMAVAVEALERGCHVLVEKPVAESPEDARRIGELADRRASSPRWTTRSSTTPRCFEPSNRSARARSERSSASTSSAAPIPAL